MSKSLQNLLMLVYRAAVQSGVLKLPGMRATFEASYGLYKRFMEARYVALLREHVEPGTTVVDVGANVGFFTRYFAAWTGPDGPRACDRAGGRQFRAAASDDSRAPSGRGRGALLRCGGGTPRAACADGRPIPPGSAVCRYHRPRRTPRTHRTRNANNGARDGATVTSRAWYWKRAA